MSIEHKITIVIVNWNTRELLQSCIQSIYKETLTPLEIIVVDNASTDGSREMVRSQFPQVRLIQNNENKGYAKASNQGMNIAGGKYVLLLNSDTLIVDRALDKMVAFMDENPNVGVCGPKILNSDGSLQSTGRRNKGIFDPIWSPAAEDPLVSLRIYSPQSRHRGRNVDEIAEVDVAAGACLLVRKSVLDNVGFFDEELDIFNEEDDLCRRVKKEGWRISYLPHAEVIHFTGQTTKKMEISESIPIMAYRSKLRFYKKYYGKGSVFLLIALTKALVLLEIVNYASQCFLPSRRIRKKMLRRWQLLRA